MVVSSVQRDPLHAVFPNIGARHCPLAHGWSTGRVETREACLKDVVFSFFRNCCGEFVTRCCAHKLVTSTSNPLTFKAGVSRWCHSAKRLLHGTVHKYEKRLDCQGLAEQKTSPRKSHLHEDSQPSDASRFETPVCTRENVKCASVNVMRLIVAWESRTCIPNFVLVRLQS